MGQNEKMKKTDAYSAVREIVATVEVANKLQKGFD